MALRRKPTRIVCSAGLISLLAVPTASVAADASALGWTHYRSSKFGYEFSYPPEVELKVYFDGSSAEILDVETGSPLAELEVWPPGECPRQPEGVSARALGIARVASLTQADGPDGSSWCGEPLTVRESASATGVAIYELELSCKSERLEGESEDGEVGGERVVTAEGSKGPTYFVDISPSWRKRVLTADPVGIVPRTSASDRRTGDSAARLRKILATLETFPIEKPNGVSIEDLRPAGPAAVHPR